MSYPYAYPIFPISAFLGFVLSITPLAWHLEAWNLGTCYFMVWTALVCLNSGINSVVWAQSIENYAPVWCEISIRIILGASVGIPASSLCIVRRLYKLASAEQRSAALVDSLICVLFPVVWIAMQCIVQDHRFDILEEIGCYPAIYNTLAAYFITFMWPMLLGLVSLVYCVFAFRAFNNRRNQFDQFLVRGSSLTVSKCLRLMALAITVMLYTTPIAVFVVYLNAPNIGPWRGWAATHAMYWRINRVPSHGWRDDDQTAALIELTRWSGPFCALMFFVYFGFAREARAYYRGILEVCARTVGLVRNGKRQFLRKGNQSLSPSSAAGRISSYASRPPVRDPASPVRPLRPVSSSSFDLSYYKSKRELSRFSNDSGLNNH
ncbi:pheromone A receptor-domain-containing protein [Mycena vitilis]|nr:pheromone A receptor-domain-containing protein [Mycena vitilis]